MIRYCDCCGDPAYYEIEMSDGIYKCVGIDDGSIKVPVIDGKISIDYLTCAVSTLYPDEEDLEKIVVTDTCSDGVLLMVTDDYFDRLFATKH